jgi:hypothetical protein
MGLHTQLLYVLLISNVTLRFFTNYFELLPRALNIFDVGITAALCMMFLFRRRAPVSDGSVVPSITRRLVLFIVVLFIGTLLNAGAIYFPAAVAQCIMLSEPILLFIVLMNMPANLPHIQRFEKILRRLIIFEFVIGLIQFPIFLSTGNSEVIAGTFSGNAEQYTGFLILGVCYYLGMIQVYPSKKGAYRALVLGLLFLIVFVDNKASWLGVIAALFFLMTRLGSLSGSRMKHALAFMMLLVVGYMVATWTSSSLYKFGGLGDAWETSNVGNLGKIKAYEDVFAAFRNEPHMLFFGSGPGTFYSRAAQQFYFITDDIYSNPSEYRKTLSTRSSNSMGGVIDPTSAVEPFYKRFYANSKIYSIGSAQVDSPFSSYAGLLGETGFVGLVIYLGFYVAVFRRLRNYFPQYCSDPNIFPLITASMGFLIYTATVSLYNPWLETGRMTTILWATLAIVYQYGERLQYEKDKAKAVSSRIFPSPLYRTKHRDAAVLTGRESQKSFRVGGARYFRQKGFD